MQFADLMTTAPVSVKNGVVALDGVILDERTHEALWIVALNVPDVTAVVDHLSLVDPTAGLMRDLVR
jgi:osmotically-inducible protein OsmY